MNTKGLNRTADFGLGKMVVKCEIGRVALRR